MRTLTPTPNGRVVTRPGVPPTQGQPGMSGRRALGLVVVLMVLFGVLIAAVIGSRSWRQTERLVAAGLRNARGVALMPDGLVVAEAGRPDAAGARDPSTRQIASGRLTWIAEASRGTLYQHLPGEYVGRLDQVLGLAAIAPAGDGRLLVLIGACDAPSCRALHTTEQDGRLTKLADLSSPRAVSGDDPYGGANPWGLAVASDGSAYVSDAGADRIVRVDRSGGVALVAQLPDRAVPTGLAIGPDGTLYAALFGAGRVVRIGLDGAVSTVADNLTLPIGVGVEPDGKLLVIEHASGTDYLARTGRLLRVDPADPSRRVIVSAGLDRPSALLVAADGRAYVTTPEALFQIRRLGPQPARRMV